MAEEEVPSNATADDYAAAAEVLNRFEDPTPWYAAAFTELAGDGLRDPPMAAVAIRAAAIATRHATNGVA